jgi:hypothetical protein
MPKTYLLLPLRMVKEDASIVKQAWQFLQRTSLDVEGRTLFPDGEKNKLPIELNYSTVGGINPWRHPTVLVVFTNRLDSVAHTCQIRVACDCKGAVDAVTAIINRTTVNSTWSSYDILILIKHQLDISSILNGPCGMLMLVGSWMTKRNGMGWDELDIWENTK